MGQAHNSERRALTTAVNTSEYNNSKGGNKQVIATTAATSDGTLAWLQSVLQKEGVSIAKAQEFAVLTNYDIVLILDDSSSMNTRSGKTTRWGELQGAASQLADIACCFDSDGIDVYFLNQGKIPNITSGSDARLARAYERGPSGSTPLTETLQKALADHSGQKPLLVMILSDGEPNGGVKRLAGVIEDSIKRSSGRIRYQLMACTDNDNAVAWMDELDVKYAEVDATDDYETERAQVLKAGIFSKFERGDWVAKACLGAVSKKWNCLDDSAHASYDRI
jgi:hypothetical protein